MLQRAPQHGASNLRVATVNCLDSLEQQFFDVIIIPASLLSFPSLAFVLLGKKGYTMLMAMVFIDYTHLYYTAIAKTGVPPTRSGKFVQIRHRSTEYLVFSPKEFTKYHANIVERFCLDKGIEGGYDSGGKRYAIADRAWIVAGGGKYEIDTNKKTIKLYDNSMAYGKFVIPGLREKILFLPEFYVFTVRIE